MTIPLKWHHEINSICVRMKPLHDTISDSIGKFKGAMKFSTIHVSRVLRLLKRQFLLEYALNRPQITGIKYATEYFMVNIYLWVRMGDFRYTIR